MKIGKYEIEEGLYNKLNSAWKSYSNSVLNGEIGELDEFMEFIEHSSSRVNHSRLVKNVLVSPEFYENTEKVNPLSDADFHKKFEPLNINEMKDIDSIVNAIQERIYYTGNIILGNSTNIEKSTSIFDSTYVYMSAEMYNTKFSLFSERGRDSTALFGCAWGGENEFAFDLIEAGRTKRMFSVISAETSSDVYYSAGVISSQEVMFSFGVMGKTYVIGNRKLSVDNYMSIKKALLEQLRDKLKRDKKVPLLLDLVGVKMDDLDVGLKDLGFVEPRKDINKDEKKDITKSFSSVTKIILGKSISDIDSVKETLENRVPELVRVKSKLSGKSTPIYDDIKEAKDRIVEYDYIFKLSEKMPLDIKGNLDDAYAISREKMVLTNESRQGENRNIFESIVIVWSHHSYKVVGPIRSRYVGYSYWPINVEHGYGLSMVHGGSYILNTYMSKNIRRAFEVDNSRSSSDIYYCHNCEDVREGLFSFNIKGKHNVIGNAELDQITYSRIKKSLVEQMAGEFANNKLKYDIYNIVKGK